MILQYIQRVREKIKEKGILYCLKRALYEIFSIFIVLCSYPLCMALNIRFLSIYVRGIGHLCIETDCYIKEGILGLRPEHNAVIVAPIEKVANTHLLNYWKQYLRIVSSPLPSFFLEPLSRSRFTQYDVSKYVCAYDACFPQIQKMYAGRPPLVSLTDDDYQRGWASLRNMGVPEGAWFVCLHCREDGFLGNVDQTNRNANISDYLLAVEAIIERGGWVIRMGDPTMKSLPPVDRAIDYAHLRIKSDWMDVFLCASCRFFLGSPSGLYALASIFGVPVGLVNLSSMSTVLPYGPNDVGIPKLVWSFEEERYLSFKEVFNSPIANYRLDDLYFKAGVRVVDNSPDEIRDVVIEMLDKIEGKSLYTDEDERLQEFFKSLIGPAHGASYGAVSRVGRDFLRKYASLLE